LAIAKEKSNNDKSCSGGRNSPRYFFSRCNGRFFKENIEFPYIVGVSAGISNAASYVSKQFGRNIEILEKYRCDNRYIGAKNFFRCKSLFGIDFVFGEIPNKLVPFDYNTFRQ
jgi:predicted patatin/cPLA2 family phospholipase